MKVLLFLLTLLAASAANAGTWALNCAYTTLTGTTASRPAEQVFSIDEFGLACYRYANADSTHNAPQNSAGTLVGVKVTAQSALVCFDPDILQAVTTTARLIPHYCPHGTIADTSNPARSCPSIGGANGNASLDGTEGTATSQNSCLRVGPGLYYFEASVACESGDTCQVTIKGEGK